MGLFDKIRKAHETAPLEDLSPMQFGTHAGRAMMDVPAEYLLWLADEIAKDPAPGPDQVKVVNYVNAGREALEEEVEKTKAGWRA
ncbi:MAG: putative quorum-sensing-regulated virulence factor [Planctomycetota bacterium]|jgi:hypothetical protein